MPNTLPLSREECSIVLLGSFNPAIFHPEWLIRYGLVSREEGVQSGQSENNEYKVSVVHNDISDFEIAFAKIEVQKSRFTARAYDSSEYVRLRDLVLGVFTILEHCPITQMGINITHVYTCDDEKLWHGIGDTLAPKNIWQKTLPGKVGMTRLSINSDTRNDDLTGQVNISVWPSIGYPPVKAREVVFQVNQHIILEKDDEQLNDLKDILTSHWDFCLSDSNNIIETSLAEAITQNGN